MKSTSSEPHDRGFMDALQDRCENCPFASIGGMDNRQSMKAPEYISADQADEYLRGYRAYCDENYGDGWETAQWVWSFKLTIEDDSDLRIDDEDSEQ